MKGLSGDLAEVDEGRRERGAGMEGGRRETGGEVREEDGDWGVNVKG